MEVGPGCGAITRYLGQCGASVVAVDGSSRRAAITASRCRDLPNVRVYCDNIATFETDTAFDIVTLIGVLEYSRRFLNGNDPIQEMLSRCNQLLKPGGLLVIAIENQLGLKYFAGAPEDHGRAPYHGVMDLYTAESVVTFGRRELTRRLQQSDFAHASFLYPLPDYKLPRIVLHDAAFEEPFDFLGMLHAANDSRGNVERVFAEEMTWPVLARNGLARDFMNSFLVVASKSAPPPLDPADRVHFYASERSRPFNKATHIRRERSGLVVRRERLCGEHNGSCGKYLHVVEDEPFLAGELYVGELVRIVNRMDWTAKDITVWARPWLQFLLAAALRPNRGDNRVTQGSEDPLLPKHFVDCTPFNMIKLSDNTLQPFDLEYVAKEPVPFSFVAFRGLYVSLGKRLTVARGKATPRIVNLILEVMKLSGFPISKQQVRSAIAREMEFQEFVNTGTTRPMSRIKRRFVITYAAMSMARRRLPMRAGRRPPSLAKRILDRLMRILRTTLKRLWRMCP